jgi:hypothetical protein
VTATNLISPAFDLSDPRIAKVTLSIVSKCDPSADDVRLIEAWDGSDWQLILEPSAGWVPPPWDLTAHAAGNPEFRIRFRYEDADRHGLWTVDDVTVVTELLDTCASSGPYPPTVAISSPEDDWWFVVGSEIVFNGSATDLEDGDLSDELVWTSSLDGPIGAGLSFSSSGLSEGEHTILAEATDSELLTGWDSVDIHVVSIEPPSHLRASAIGRTPSVTMGWKDNSDNETAFEVERSLSPITGFALVRRTGPNVTAFYDVGLESQTTYYYRVRACAEQACSSWSDVVDATTY